MASVLRGIGDSLGKERRKREGIPDRAVGKEHTIFVALRGIALLIRINRESFYPLLSGFHMVFAQAHPAFEIACHPAVELTQGRHERMHRELKAEATRPPGNSFRTQQRKFDAFRAEYNEVRPHEALAMKTPAEVHKRSNREYPQRVAEWVYPVETKVKLVTVNGALRWNREGFIMVSTALSGRYVGLEPVDDGVWIVTYRHFSLGVLSEQTKRVYELEDYRL